MREDARQDNDARQGNCQAKATCRTFSCSLSSVLVACFTFGSQNTLAYKNAALQLRALRSALTFVLRVRMRFGAVLAK